VGVILIYVCVPAHDEGATLGPVLWKLRKVFTDPAFRRDFHVVVLDDGSADDTSGVLERYRAFLPLTALRSDTSLGYGAAVHRVLEHVVDVCAYPKRDAAVVLQADFTEDAAGLVDIVKTFEGGADIVAGAAEPGARSPQVGERWARRLAPWVLGRAHTAAPVVDPLCGLRAYRVVVLKKALRDGAPLCASPEPWAASLELLARTAPHARRLDDAPVVVHHERRVRPSRFRGMRALRSLAPLRGRTRWPQAGRAEA
jgi:glycosyltransferase involved in cell wall biosynthesis